MGNVSSSSVTLLRTTRLAFHPRTRLDNIYKAQDSRLITTVAFDYLVIDFLFSYSFSTSFTMSNPFLAGMDLTPTAAPNPFGSAGFRGG
jgi:hypothetical protein